MNRNRNRYPEPHTRVQAAIQAALALCASAALALVLPTDAPLHERTNSFVWIICACGVFFLLRYACQVVTSRRGRLFFCACGFLVGFVFVLGRYVYLYHEAQNVIAMLLLALLLAPAVAAVLACVMDVFQRSAVHSREHALHPNHAFFERKHVFLLAFFAILICYIPCFLAYFPANINYDIANQTQQVVSGQFSANHPLLHTLLIKVCLDAGMGIFKSYTSGFALYAIVQTLLLSACFSYAFCCIVRLTPRQNVLHWATLLFFCLYPSNAIFAITTTKDVLASGAMLVSLCAFCMLLFDAPETQKKRLPLLLLFLLSSVLAMLLRNGTVYAYIVFALCIVMFAKKLRVRLLIPTLLSIGLFYGASSTLKVACRAADSNPVEMLSVPLQQLVNANITYPERFTAEEQALYDALIESNDRYLPHISDPIKEFVDKDVLLSNRKAYWRLYCSIGKKAPDAYVNAFLLLNLATWYPDEITHSDVHTDGQGYLHTSNWFYTWDRAAVRVEKHSYLPAVERLYDLFSKENLHQKIPLLSMLFSPGFLCQVMFVLGMLIIYSRQGAHLLPFAPLFAYWAGLLFAPCIYIRYVYPIIICIPLLIALTQRAYSARAGKSAEPKSSAIVHGKILPVGNGKGLNL